MTSRIPYFDFYPADFMHGVRGLSAQDVGVYTMILCRIYEENGPVEYNSIRLATYCGMREATFIKTFEKLVTLDKFQVEDGMISNRRAIIEISNRANKLKINSKAGKASAEKRQQKQRRDPTDVQRTFNHTDTDTDTDNYAANAGARSVDARMGELYAALGVTDETKTPGLLTFSEPIRWEAAGCDVDSDILPALRSIAARGKQPKSWAYCSAAVFEARDSRLAPAPAIKPRQATAPPGRSGGVSGAARRIMEGLNDGSEGIFGDNGDAKRISTAGGSGSRHAASDLRGGSGRPFLAIDH